MTNLAIQWPDGFNWWAMDADFSCMFYVNKPVNCGNGWDVEDNSNIKEDDYLPVTTDLDWIKSLTERPQEATADAEHSDGSIQSYKIERPTLRDQFAMAALPGLVTCLNDDYWSDGSNPVEVSKRAYAVADALMNERSK